MARRKDHSREELKEMILSTAWDIIESGGVGRLTAREISKKIGYVPGTIYNIFPSMDVLHLHVNAMTLNLLAEKLEKAAQRSRGKSLEERLLGLARAYLAFAQMYRPFWMALFSDDLSGLKETQSWYGQAIEDVFQPLEGILREDCPNKPGIREESHILWSSVHGITYLWATGKLPPLAGKAGSKAPASEKKAEWEKMVSKLVGMFCSSNSS
ncbi:MAG: TetR/AcrR family transcriptional regulator [Pseudobdellovibrionaceae bacterium]|jgi:AcrR family transcriptional regulator|nr:TetR/AcrR family transcriptional regulator [Pseudobdellovibrionaceae bacterium]